MVFIGGAKRETAMTNAAARICRLRGAPVNTRNEMTGVAVVLPQLLPPSRPLASSVCWASQLRSSQLRFATARDLVPCGWGVVAAADAGRPAAGLNEGSVPIHTDFSCKRSHGASRYTWTFMWPSLPASRLCMVTAPSLMDRSPRVYLHITTCCTFSPPQSGTQSLCASPRARQER